jgi:hypothetical protein
MSYTPHNQVTGFAMFFLAQHTKTRKNIPNDHKMYPMAMKFTNWPQNIANGNKIYQNLPLQDPPKLGFLVFKYGNPAELQDEFVKFSPKCSPTYFKVNA